MSLTKLKAEAKELGIKGYTKYKLENIGELLRLVEAAKEELTETIQEDEMALAQAMYEEARIESRDLTEVEKKRAEVIEKMITIGLDEYYDVVNEIAIDEADMNLLTEEDHLYIDEMIGKEILASEKESKEVEPEKKSKDSTQKEIDIPEGVSKVKYNQIAKALGNSQDVISGVYNNEIACMTTEKELLPEGLKEIMDKEKVVEVSELEIDTKKDKRKLYDRIKLNNGEYIVLDNSLSKMMLGGKRNQRTKVYFSQSSSSKVILENHGLYVSIAPVMCNLMHSA